MGITQKRIAHPKGQTKAQDQLLRQLGLKIMKDLAARGMTIDGLALRIGIARSTLREIAAGRSNPRLLTLIEISQGLGYSRVQDFFEGF